MEFKSLVNKLFIGGVWIVGVRERHTPDMLYYRLLTRNGEWLADPFLYEVNGKHYLFVEQYYQNKNRAGIGVLEITEGERTIDVINIIDTPYHMSYPCIFSYKGEHWMIPESASNQTLDLYKATDFPYKWEQVTHLLENKRVVDTTAYIKGDDVFLLSYETVLQGWDLVIYQLDLLSYGLTKITTVHYDNNVGRPAGRLFMKDGRLYRPAQNCVLKYGESLLFYEVTEFTNNTYHEEFSYEVKCNEVRMNAKFERIHTYNSDSKYEVIDVFQEQFDLFHWWKIFKRKYLKS